MVYKEKAYVCFIQQSDNCTVNTN